MSVTDEAVVVFQDGKEPGALRTIGEVASALGIRQHVLRYWEEQFPGLKPLKRSGGRRYYRPEDVQMIATIDRLVHREGYTLRGARQAIEGRRTSGSTGGSAGGTASIAPTAAISAQATSAMSAGLNSVAQLRAIRDGLAAALAAA